MLQLITVDEAVGDFRSGVKEKGYIMRLLEYSYQVSDSGQHEVLKMHQGGFLIAHSYSERAGGAAAYMAAKGLAEKVMDEMIEKMIADSKNGHPLFYYSLDSRQDFNVTPVKHVGDASYTGYLCLFTFRSWFRNCITDPTAPAWVDEGVTPHDV